MVHTCSFAMDTLRASDNFVSKESQNAYGGPSFWANSWGTTGGCTYKAAAIGTPAARVTCAIPAEHPCKTKGSKATSQPVDPTQPWNVWSLRCPSSIPVPKSMRYHFPYVSAPCRSFPGLGLLPSSSNINKDHNDTQYFAP